MRFIYSYGGCTLSVSSVNVLGGEEALKNVHHKLIEINF